MSRRCRPDGFFQEKVIYARYHIAVLALIGLLALAIAQAGCSGASTGRGAGHSSIPMDDDDIAGTVRSRAGPEAGVWVIAETDEFDTRFARIVVTDDAGRYLVPDLPDADYRIWVRGYGLADSVPVAATPGDVVDLQAMVAADAAIAARVYPAAYWYAMMNLPNEQEVAQLGGLNHYLM